MYDKYLNRLDGCAVGKPKCLIVRARAVNRYQGEKPLNYLILLLIFACLTVFSFLAALSFSGLFFIGGMMLGLFTLAFCKLCADVYEMRRDFLEEQKKSAHQLTVPLSESIEKHNYAVKTICQTIRLQKSFNEGGDDQRFIDLIDKVVVKIEENAKILKQRTELYVAVTETPENVYLDFGKVIAEDLAMPEDLDASLLIDLSEMRQRMETQVILPELNEVLECREFLAIKG